MSNPVRETENRAKFSARIKYFPTSDGEFQAWDTVLFSRGVYNPHKFEAVSDFDRATDTAFRQRRPFIDDYVEDVEAIGGEPEEASEMQTNVRKNNGRSVNRAKTKVFDYIMANPDLDLFVTLTFDPSVVDRTSYADILKLLNIWLDNRVRRCGLKYVLVPEYHTGATYAEKGMELPQGYTPDAIHFHGLFNSSADIEVEPTGIKRRGRMVYSLHDYTYGYSSVMRRGKTAADVAKTAKYIFKYMTKSEGAKIGGRYYLHGGRLDRPKYVYYRDEQGFGKDEIPVFLDGGLEFVRCDGVREGLTTLSRLSRDFFGAADFVALEL